MEGLIREETDQEILHPISATQTMTFPVIAQESVKMTDRGLEMLQLVSELSAKVFQIQLMDKLPSLLEFSWDLEQFTLATVATSLTDKAQEPAREMEAGQELHQSVVSSDVVD